MWGSRKFSQRGGGGGGVQIPRRGPTENFNMEKINNLAMPGGGGGGPDPLSPPPPMHPSHYPRHRELEPTYTGHSGETKD